MEKPNSGIGLQQLPAVIKQYWYVPTLLLILALLFLAGSWYGQSKAADQKVAGSRRILYYVDPMNPAHTSPEPGLAPCGMKMEPVYADDGDRVAASTMPPGSVKITPEKQQIIGVRLGQVAKTPWSFTLRALGRVEVDETRIYRLNSASNGFIRQVYPNSTGSLVMKDAPLVTYYNPEILPEQARFIGSLSLLDQRDRVSLSPLQTAANTQAMETVLKNLEGLGMGKAQIEELIRTRKPTLEITLRAPATSFILARNVSPGLKFDRGFELYKLADLTRVWITADLFGNEAQYVRPKEKATVSLPDQQQAFQATVSDVLPQVDPTTRSFKVRLEADNPGYALRPDMFVDVEFPINLPPAITVPADAVLDSGLKKTVFVDRGNGFFEPRRVETGRRFGEQVEIVQGLKPGERIVISGNFLIDSESRMRLAAAGMFGEVTKDHVCGLNVDESKAKSLGFQSIFNNQAYYFCSEGCKQHFDKNPERYVSKGTEPPKAQGTPGDGEGQAVSVAMSKDPVCGMEVDGGKARAAGRMSEYQGQTYFFDSDICKQNFDKEPQSYAGKGAEPPKAQGVTGDGKGQAVSVAMSKDPVCGMEVDGGKARTAGRMSEYQGQTYFFDFDICKLVFDNNMAKYAGKDAETKKVTGFPPDTKEQPVPPGMVKDPVCGKVVNEVPAKATGKMSQYQGQTYFFDSEQCKQNFDKEPERYSVKAAVVPKEALRLAGQRTQGLSLGVLQDPVCGTPVIEGTARDFGLVSEYRGTAYFFDSIQCKQNFDKKPELYVGKGAGTKKKPPVSGEKTLPPGLAKDPVSGFNVDESKAKAVGLVSEYQGKTYYFFNIYFKNNFDEEPERYLSKKAGTPKEAVSPAGNQKAAAPPAMSKDPVCGMDVDESKAKAAGWVSEYQGKTYYFDSYQCNRQFGKEPARYVGQAAGKGAQKQQKALPSASHGGMPTHD
ncbi:MAG: YHS domain-containing protein [Deltaproteobacteria bacterium]|nr:YHS domain-containing protein [Deltaproteobacteria bacterium]